MPTQSTLALLLDWLDGLAYRDIRRAESVQTAPIHVGQVARPLRGVRIAPDLVLGRDRQFYRIIDDHAVVIPTALVIQQYTLRDITRGYERAVQKQPRSRRKKSR